MRWEIHRLKLGKESRWEHLRELSVWHTWPAVEVRIVAGMLCVSFLSCMWIKLVVTEVWDLNGITPKWTSPVTTAEWILWVPFIAATWFSLGKWLIVGAEEESGRWAGWLPLAAEIHSCPGHTLLWASEGVAFIYKSLPSSKVPLGSAYGVVSWCSEGGGEWGQLFPWLAHCWAVDRVAGFLFQGP